jgi:hypothetical protein
MLFRHTRNGISGMEPITIKEEKVANADFMFSDRFESVLESSER